MTAFTIIVIALGWAIALHRRASLRTLMGVASILVGAALVIAHYETELTRYLIALRHK